MRLDVVTPQGRLLSVEATEVTAPGIKGEFGVLPGHVPFLSGLKPGVLTYSGAQVQGLAAVGKLAVGAGYAEVSHDRVIVLAEEGAAPKALAEALKETGQIVPEIDAEAARKDLAEATRELEQAATGEDVVARTLAQKKFDWAQARLDALA